MDEKNTKHVGLRLSRQEYEIVYSAAEAVSGGKKPNLQAFIVKFLVESLDPGLKNESGLTKADEKFVDRFRRVLRFGSPETVDILKSTVKIADESLTSASRATGS